MAAQGTGLPASRGAAVTPLADTGGYGAAEEATATALFQAAKGLDNLVQQMEPALQQEAVVRAEQKIAAGEFEQRTAITGFDQTYNRAMRSGTLARLANARDADLDAFTTEFAFDPDGLQSRLQQYRSDSIKATVPGELAVEWSLEFDQRATRALGQVRSARAQADIQEAKTNTTTRIERLTKETIDLAGGRPWASLADDPEIQGNILQITLMTEELAANPAYGVSSEQALAIAEESINEMIAGASASEHLTILRTQGADAALASIQRVATSDAFTSDEQRQLVVAKTRAAVSDEINLSQQRQNMQNQARALAEQEWRRLVDEDAASIALNGTGSGLTEKQVFDLGGNTAVLAWNKTRASAIEDRELYRDLPSDPEEAAAEIERRISRQSFDALPIISDDMDLMTYTAAIESVESNGVNGLVSADPDGAGPAGGGAYGLRQLLPETARRVAGQLGLPFDVNRLRNDAAYNRAIGDQHFKNLTAYYRGDAFLAVTAYHAGEGNVDGWLRSVGDPRTGEISRDAWLDGIERRGNPRSAEYPRKVLSRMGAGRAAAAYDQYAGEQARVRQDPAASVMREPDVRNAYSLWQSDQGTENGEALVASFQRAQERKGIAAGDRRALPNAVMLPYARALASLEAKPEEYRAMSEAIVDRFGEKGEDVLRDVMILRGNSAYASQIAAAATTAAVRGTPPPTRQQAAAANRSTVTQNAVTGNGRNVRALPDDELLAAAGLQ